MNKDWNLKNDFLAQMAARRMANHETLQRPKVWVDDDTGVGMVAWGKNPETGLAYPDCLVDMERVKTDAEDSV